MGFVKTGIGDFDALFANGGYPRGNTILVLGGPGSGKSIFGMQYIFKGASSYDEPGVFVTLDEDPDKIRKNMAVFGWDLKKLEEEGKLIILDAVSARAGAKTKEQYAVEAVLDFNSVFGQIRHAIKQINAQRLVIDSLSVVNLYSQSEFAARTTMLRMANTLSGLNVTSLLISEAKTVGIGTTEFPIETFMFDGVITMHLDTDAQERRIAIRKMRGTKHVLGTYRFQISESGIVMTP